MIQALIGVVIGAGLAAAGQWFIMKQQQKFQREMWKAQQDFQTQLQADQQKFQNAMLNADIVARTGAAQYQREVDAKREMERRNFESELQGRQQRHDRDLQRREGNFKRIGIHDPRDIGAG